MYSKMHHQQNQTLREKFGPETRIADVIEKYANVFTAVKPYSHFNALNMAS